MQSVVLICKSCINGPRSLARIPSFVCACLTLTFHCHFRYFVNAYAVETFYAVQIVLWAVAVVFCVFSLALFAATCIDDYFQQLLLIALLFAGGSVSHCCLLPCRLVHQEKTHVSNPDLWFILTCTKRLLFYWVHTIQQILISRCMIFARKIIPYFERQSLAHGQSPTSLVPCFFCKSTAFMPRALPSPRTPVPTTSQQDIYLLTQMTLTCGAQWYCMHVCSSLHLSRNFMFVV